MVDLGRWLDGTYSLSEPVTAEDLEQLKHRDECDREEA
jgi:endogenous inhibitor of DNA gyrase (YacG/DUF329 family)